MSRLAEANRIRRLLWLNHDSYSAPLLAGSSPPWLESAACAAWMRQAQGLLGSDVLTVPLADIVAAWLVRNPALKAEMAGKTRRAHLPLKACLASAPLREHTAALATALRAALPDTIFTLKIPTPRDWAGQTLALAGGPPDVEVDEDAADAAAASIADFLRVFATTGVDAVVLDELRAWDEDDAAHWLELYQPVTNVARHYGWDWGLRLPAAVKFGQGPGPDFTVAPSTCCHGPVGLLVPEAFWSDDDLPAPQPNTFDVADIPATARPETVLARLAVLRERRLTW
ncbi:hypothetical protein CNE_BB1p08510 (plasmid) [Cupriavidus necator N-1]|uniref:Uncharacterized protein n=1 Tax=Cupriavidus necator (strain ATCC 43291 / DSM 13513 / CCUG 52238 / LMG 8453 / N-1) TaxID=1042878 RepID=F8GU61_CUPNN|nr:hypothetical protein [Cupriavidus necator]AEI82265.1 hypothetical protein CNE_BB1p08510 [Cupriavidus necator N-1]MDX6007285.1 hypothetical protein [Cupriavidus necator]